MREALAEHRKRLLDELRTARPELVVTLGNAALRVLRELCDVDAVDDPGTALRPDEAVYGQRRPVRIGPATAQWVPLAHPAAPKPYQRAHDAWGAAATSA